MKWVDDFRAPDDVRALAEVIRREADPSRTYRFMEFCGGHTHVLSRWGLTGLLPENVRMIHGPGCPVCVLPIGRIEMAAELALDKKAIVCTYADTLRVPAKKGRSLMAVKAEGGDIRAVYSPTDALRIARENPTREVVFFAIGFETTTPPTAASLLRARAEGLQNFSVLSSHVLTPPAMRHILTTTDARHAPPLDGLVGPAHVSVVTGWGVYEPFAKEFGKPVVVAGFEPADMMLAIRMLVAQVNDGRHDVENEFTRAVTKEGNVTAQALMRQVFTLRESFLWRGLGEVPLSALRLRDDWAAFDAEKRFALQERRIADHKDCACPAILRGEKAPRDCPLFGTVCTPAHPIGACMVSSEGACAAELRYAPRAMAPAEMPDDKAAH